MCCVADVLNDPLLFEIISYIILRPGGANGGGFHEIVSCRTCELTERSET